MEYLENERVSALSKSITKKQNYNQIKLYWPKKTHL